MVHNIIRNIFNLTLLGNILVLLYLNILTIFVDENSYFLDENPHDPLHAAKIDQSCYYNNEHDNLNHNNIQSAIVNSPGMFKYLT